MDHFSLGSMAEESFPFDFSGLPEYDGEITDHDGEPLQKKQKSSYHCDICGTSFTELRSLRRHERGPAHRAKIGKEIELYRCEDCDKVFSRDDIRQRHVKVQHSDNEHERSAHNVNGDTTPRDYFGELDLGTDSQAGPIDDVLLDTSFMKLIAGPTKNSVSHAHCEIYPFHKSGPPRLTSSESNQARSDIPLACNLKGGVLDVDETFEMFAGTKFECGVSRTQLTSPQNSLEARPALTMDATYSTLTQRGASPRVPTQKTPLVCHLCQVPFGDNVQEIHEHISRHSAEFRSHHLCDTCQISFTRRENLEYHLKRAHNGHCGFDFAHAGDCTGHHPPLESSEKPYGRDHFELCRRIQHWEQSQLQLHLFQINQLVNTSHTRKDFECWSIGALRNSMESVTSFLSNMNLRSTPDPLDYQQQLSTQPSNSWLLRLGAARLRPVRSVSKHSELSDGEQALACAVAGRDHNLVGKLLKSGANVHAHVPFFETVLVLAAQYCDLHMVELLLAHNPDVNQLVSHHGSALGCAVHRGDINIVTLLLENGANPNLMLSDGRTFALAMACWSGNASLVARLLAWGANVEQRDRQGKTALGVAAFAGHIEVVSKLLAHGAQVHTADNQERSPLSEAVSNGKEDVIDLLLASGAKVDWKSSEYGSLLELAAYRGRRNIVESLLARGLGRYWGPEVIAKAFRYCGAMVT